YFGLSILDYSLRPRWYGLRLGGRQILHLARQSPRAPPARSERLADGREIMFRTRKLVSIIGATAAVVGTAVVGAGGPAGASSVPKGYEPLPGSVASFTTHGTVTG